LLFFQRVAIMAFCFITFAMRKVYFSSMLAVPVFHSIIVKPFLTRRCSGFATLAAELIR
jgi:HAD superfamily hydrolase (TIGR01509 family)